MVRRRGAGLWVCGACNDGSNLEWIIVGVGSGFPDVLHSERDKR